MGKRPIGLPQLRFKDACKHDFKAISRDTETLENVAKDRDSWRNTLYTALNAGEENTPLLNEEKRLARKKKKISDGGLSRKS